VRRPVSLPLTIPDITDFTSLRRKMSHDFPVLWPAVVSGKTSPTADCRCRGFSLLLEHCPVPFIVVTDSTAALCLAEEICQFS
jgi:hypothetical protein